ncbi:hypothetical protein Lfu02_64070 [Longispora fulva]|uniref:Mg-chelatase subunit ChlD n=1 Tax=Longispora fulva TaxID=619741 RepID=A0A8J7KXG7_9ACTN|nr:DUF5682 family protein [Longispora fulva]MBG6137807.1 Mg-chelatase subunit ChlD [Longispora fulva]GIG62035.1 hypothetical protein Lfu02_64070 [Longispora fulva]
MSSPTDGHVGDPEVAVGALAGSTVPHLIGVRHHSPALAAVLPALLDAADPEVLLLELPPELGGWIPWLADPGTVAPVALAGVVGDSPPAFYPFADFSPELAAIRWAARRGVPVVPCDLPLADPAWRAGEDRDGPDPVLSTALRDAATGRPGDDMWDRTVEARAPGADPEEVRRAALLVGWALRDDARRGGGVSGLDLRREAWMRRVLAETLRGEMPLPAGPGTGPAAGTAPGGAGRRVTALVGSFHAAALAVTDEPVEPGPSGVEVATSLVAYTFGLLDERSGYPAGIRDPAWQQCVLEAGADPVAVENAAVAAVVRVCAYLRSAGHPAGPAEARETVRMALDLARLRGLPAPGRGELVEAMGSVLAHGDVLGRGRVVAAAMENVLVGERRGALAAGTPRSGLRPAVQRLLTALGLPGPGAAEKDLRLDPLRSDLDRRRDIVLNQLTVCGVGYATPAAVEGLSGSDGLTTRWRLEWTPGTDAMLDLAGLRGVTLAQSAHGTLTERHRRLAVDGGPTIADVLGALAAAARCGLPGLAAERLAELAVLVPATASLPETVAALALLDQLRLGHIAGLGRPDPDRLTAIEATTAEVETAAVRQLDGLAGSEDPADARALAALAQRSDAHGVGLRLEAALGDLADTGAPVISAAAHAVLVLLGRRDQAGLALRVTSWVDGAGSPPARRTLQAHLAGLLTVAEPLLQAGGPVFDDLLGRVETLPDAAFLARLPALRGGFHTVSPAGRDRLLAVVDGRLGGGTDIDAPADSGTLLARLLADRAGLAALGPLGLAPAGEFASNGGPPPDAVGSTPPGVQAAPEVEATGSLGPLDRWRLLLGRDTSGLTGRAGRYATALDELYGAGRGEGRAADDAGRAGREAAFPGVRDWAEELEVLFGAGVREEVLARAVEAGRIEAAGLLDPDTVRPSVELLQAVLSLAGAMPESAVAKLRPLVARIVAELTRELATRLRPALSGLNTPRPTYRPGGRLNLPRTLRANLAASRRRPDGSLMLVPEKPVFHTRARKGVDWRLVLVVDVSGSMEASVIWSALTASVLAGVPALTTHFLAFSTEIVDLTDRVSDPLGLLLEVRVGGGTHIAKGLRHARSLVTVPSRTMVVVVSDFEEGYPVSGLLAETRALVESGCTVLGCASLDDTGRPRYSVSVASQLVAAGMPVAALSPLELARWVGEQTR